MATMGEVLQMTEHYSGLVRRAEALGFRVIEEFIALAVLRGCSHYRNAVSSVHVDDPGLAKITNEDLVVLLLHNHYEYEPMAVRCAAQLLKKRGFNAKRVAFLARRERSVEALHYIAALGVKHDTEGVSFWQELLEGLSQPQSEIPDGVMPHVSRFMINPGVQRGGVRPAQWLAPKG